MVLGKNSCYIDIYFMPKSLYFGWQFISNEIEFLPYNPRYRSYCLYIYIRHEATECETMLMSGQTLERKNGAYDYNAKTQFN
jgi:hypothetical protein